MIMMTFLRFPICFNTALFVFPHKSSPNDVSFVTFVLYDNNLMALHPGVRLALE